MQLLSDFSGYVQRLARLTEKGKHVKHVKDAKQNSDVLGKSKKERLQKKDESMKRISRGEGPILTLI